MSNHQLDEATTLKNYVQVDALVKHIIDICNQTDDLIPIHKINVHSVNFIQGSKQKKDFRLRHKRSMDRRQTRRDSHKNQVYGKD